MTKLMLGAIAAVACAMFFLMTYFTVNAYERAVVTRFGQVVSIEAIGLMRKMPVEAVMRMAFVGRYERMSAQRAYELGMISEVVDPPERLREAAQELAEKIAKNSPAAMAATKRALWGALETGLTEACRLGAKELVSMWGHPDQTEGPAAFAEKRDAQWLPPQ